MRTVAVESPYAGDVVRNVEYAKACVKDCLLRGEAPFASHLLYTLPGILDDSDPVERFAGLRAGRVISAKLDATVVYFDFGISSGMESAIFSARAEGRVVEFRSLPFWKGGGN